ncbi:MAG: desulfoferrodoxin [Defluviitaleaceae bacterium]|nr:desulfoferrodoxin [Defluviitaleaceae bacterium]
MAKFHLCEVCGNLTELVKDNGGPLNCCGKPMKFLTPNTVEASHEKHIPVVTKTENGVKVAVGSVLHPMGEDHFIDFIVVKSAKCCHRVMLDINGAPEAEFCCLGEGPIEVYAYCNLHGMWKA